MTCGVYRIVNIVTGDFYIGSSACMESRWQNHKSDLWRCKHSNRNMQRIFNEHGLFSFVFEAVAEPEELTKLALCRLELECIEQMKPTLNHLAESNKLRKIIAYEERCLALAIAKAKKEGRL